MEPSIQVRSHPSDQKHPGLGGLADGARRGVRRRSARAAHPHIWKLGLDLDNVVLIQNLRVSDKKKDQGKSFGKRVEMHVLQGLATLFKNRSTGQVATVTRISGSTSDPRLSQWEAIRKLLSNGLFRAILPGFLDKQDPKPAKTS